MGHWNGSPTSIPTYPACRKLVTSAPRPLLGDSKRTVASAPAVVMKQQVGFTDSRRFHVVASRALDFSKDTKAQISFLTLRLRYVLFDRAGSRVSIALYVACFTSSLSAFSCAMVSWCT